MRDLYTEYVEAVALAHQPAMVLDIDIANAAALPPARRMEVRLYEGASKCINALRSLGVRVIMASGRPVSEVYEICERSGLDMQGLEIFGDHGWEYRTAGGMVGSTTVPQEAQEALLRAAQLEEAIKAHGGICELKKASFVVHHRDLSAEQITEIKGLVSERSRKDHLEPHLKSRGMDGGIDLYVPGRDKGCVVEMAALTTNVVSLVGDDYTDNDGFKVIRRKREADPNFRGLAVLSRYAKREGFADDHWVKPPEGLLAFYDRLIEARQRYYASSVLHSLPAAATLKVA